MNKDKKYSLTEEHKAQLPAWRDKWIANAMSTKPMDAEDRTKTHAAIKGMYAAANLTPPIDSKIVFVESPFVARFAGGFAAAIYYMESKGDKVDFKKALDAAATASDTYSAVLCATLQSVRDGTDYTTKGTISDNSQLKKDKWFVFDSKAMLQLSEDLGIGKFGLECASNAWRMYQGGNQWSAWDSFISFFRHIAKLDLDYSKWDHWETASLHSSFRIMHKDFCIISDRPRVLTVNDKNQPHNETGPFCKWSDGSSLYSLNGVRVPAWLVETPAKDIDISLLLKETNAQVRAEIVRKVGINRVVAELKSEVIDKQDDYELLLLDLGDGRKREFLKMKNPSVNLVHVEGVKPGIKTVQDALAWRNGTEVKPTELS